MISANVCFSWNSNSDTACNNSPRSVKVVRRYLLNAFSARLNRFSISASSKGENSFSFSPVAGLMEASAIQLNKHVPSICHPKRSKAESKDPVEIAQIFRHRMESLASQPRLRSE